MTRARPIILLTGFGPFPGTPENASSYLVREVAGLAGKAFPSFRFEAHVLATEWYAAPATARTLYETLKPEAALHFGVSSKARTIEIETMARNRVVQVADACGALPYGSCVAVGGPDALPTRLPVGQILVRLRNRKIPAIASRDAGGYLCNTLLYHGANFTRLHNPDLKTGFIHLPAALKRNGRRLSKGLMPHLDWDQAIAGAVEIIATTLRQPPRAYSGTS